VKHKTSERGLATCRSRVFLRHHREPPSCAGLRSLGGFKSSPSTSAESVRVPTSSAECFWRNRPTTHSSQSRSHPYLDKPPGLRRDRKPDQVSRRPSDTPRRNQPSLGAVAPVKILSRRSRPSCRLMGRLSSPPTRHPEGARERGTPYRSKRNRRMGPVQHFC
jgi:hypothetical protein